MCSPSLCAQPQRSAAAAAAAQTDRSGTRNTDLSRFFSEVGDLCSPFLSAQELLDRERECTPASKTRGRYPGTKGLIEPSGGLFSQFSPTDPRNTRAAALEIEERLAMAYENIMPFQTEFGFLQVAVRLLQFRPESTLQIPSLFVYEKVVQKETRANDIAPPQLVARRQSSASDMSRSRRTLSLLQGFLCLDEPCF